MPASSKLIRKTIRIGGKRVSQYFRTRAMADAWYRQMSDQKRIARSGLELEPEDITIGIYAAKFIARRMNSRVHNTWINDEQRMRTYILPSFKDRAMRSVTMTEWKSFLESIVTEKGKSKATSNQVRALASRMYNDAIEEGKIKDNPIRRVKPYNLKRSRVKKIKEHFWHHLADLVHYLEASKDEEPGYYVYKYIECNTGLRRSQIVPLKWKDYDRRMRVFNVERAYMASNDTIRAGSKGFADGEDYAVGINDALLEVIEWWRKQTPFPGPEDYICVQTKKKENRGKHFYSWHLRKAHERIIKRVNETRTEAAIPGQTVELLKRIKPHGIRHTYATHYVESGGRLENLQKMLGHKDLSTTQIYAHVVPKTMSEKANAMNVRAAPRGGKAKALSPRCHQMKFQQEEE